MHSVTSVSCSCLQARSCGTIDPMQTHDAKDTWQSDARMVLRVVAVFAQADLGAAVSALVGVGGRQALLAAGHWAARLAVHFAVVLWVAAAGGVPAATNTAVRSVSACSGMR